MDSGVAVVAAMPRTGASEQPAAFPAFWMMEDGRSPAPSVSVVVPAKNEARNLSHVFASIPSWVGEIVLVDGHSTDDTATVARRLLPGVRVVAQQGQGKGDALRAGFEAAKGDIIVMIDADGSTDGAEIPRFVGALLAGADFVKGSRFASGGASDDITRTRRLGNWVLSGLVNRLFGTRYTDLCYGYNAFWARHLAVLNIDCEGFEVETVMNIRAARLGLRVHEVPSHEHTRIHGVSNLHIVKDGWRIAKVIVRERLSRQTSPSHVSPESPEKSLASATQPLQAASDPR